jgi:uridine kinase
MGNSRGPIFPTRVDLIGWLAARIDSTPRPHPLCVAVDGVDAAGKTTLADELVVPLAARGRPIIRASIDGFHRARVDRHRRGAESPEGYFLDSFDHDAIQANLLIPLGPVGTRRYRTAAFDHRTDQAVQVPQQVAPPQAVLIFDGVFLLRPELNGSWDFRIFVAVDFEITLARAIERDRALLGGPAAAELRYRRRYISGQQIYLRAVRPLELADAVIDNSDPSKPRVL